MHDKEDKFAAGFYILKIMYSLPSAQIGQFLPWKNTRMEEA